MPIKQSATFSCFLLAAFEAGGHRPQPNVRKAVAEAERLTATDRRTVGVAHRASNEASGFYCFCQLPRQFTLFQTI